MEQILVKTYPREIAAFEVPKQDERIIGVHAIFGHEANLEQVVKQLSDNSVWIKHADINEHAETKNLIINAFLDISKSRDGGQGFRDSLKNLDHVEKLVISDKKQVLHQTSLFPIVNRQDRIIFQSTRRLQYVRDQLERILTPSGLSVIYYNMGFEGGRGMHQLFSEEFNSGMMDTGKRLELLRDHSISGGMGIYDFTDLNLKTHSGIVKLYEDYECENVAKNNPVCHSARGTLGGFLSLEWPDKKLKVLELKCRAIGDPHCEFAVGE